MDFLVHLQLPIVSHPSTDPEKVLHLIPILLWLSCIEPSGTHSRPLKFQAHPLQSSRNLNVHNLQHNMITGSYPQNTHSYYSLIALPLWARICAQFSNATLVKSYSYGKIFYSSADTCIESWASHDYLCVLVKLNANGAKVLCSIQVIGINTYFKLTRLSSEITRRTYNDLGRERKISRMAILGSSPICATVMRLRYRWPDNISRQ